MTVFIIRGEAYLEPIQAINRGLRHYNGQLPGYQRETGLLLQNQAYLAWAAQWLEDNVTNTENNAFNKQLRDYRAASARLGRYRLADGRVEVLEEQDTPNVDEDGNTITESVIVLTAINALPAEVEQVAYVEVEQVVYDEFGEVLYDEFDQVVYAMVEEAVTEMVPNPAIVADDLERASAQVVIDSTPQDVIEFPDEP
jgi:hypothetical protein